MNQSQSMRIVVIGGGTGTMAVLSGLKKYDDLDISVVVNMTDDGGSNKVVRDEFGFLPLSDLRKSIIALAPDGNEILRNVFTYRFDKGNGLKGHTLGNLIMMGLSDSEGNEMAAIRAASDLFCLKGTVIPVTVEHTHLVAEYDDGTIVKSEHRIDEPEHEGSWRIKSLTIDPKVSATKEAIDAILHADVIVAGPGDFYTSTLANIIVDGIPEAIQKSKGTFIFINNLMTKQGQTQDLKASDLVQEIENYSGRLPDVVVQHSGSFAENIMKKYEERGEHPIEDDLKDGVSYKIIRTSLTHDDVVQPESGDDLVRSLIRHDADKLGNVLYDVISII